MTKSITTVSGKFYVGMTREEAETKEIAKRSNYESFCAKVFSVFGQKPADLNKFDDLDLNRDGILQGSEICHQRDYEVSDKKKRKWGALLGGVITSLAAPILIINPATAVIVSLATIGLTAYGLFAKDGSKEQEETEKYRQENLYNKEIV